MEYSGEKSQNRPGRRTDTIRELRRMIYPSRGVTRQTPRRSQPRPAGSHQEVPFMTFVPDPNDSLASMEDSLNDLLQQLGSHPSAARRFNHERQASSATTVRREPQQPQRQEPPVPDIPRRLLLDNLSDEEEQVPEETKRQKCHFFQDLLLSTLTEQKLTMKVSGSDSSFSSQKPNGRQCDKRKSSKAACGKKKNKENNNNNTTPSLATDHAAANNHIENRPSTSDSDEP